MAQAVYDASVPRPRTHDDAVRIRLLEAASTAVADGGAAALSLRGVAAAADTTTAAVYTLFGSREALLEATVTEGFRRFAAHLDAVPRTADPGADLLALGVAYRDNALENPHFYRVMFSPDTTGAGSAETELRPAGVHNPTFAVLRDAVARATGWPEPEAEAGAVQLWAFAHGLVSLELAGLLPGEPSERRAHYVSALRTARLSEVPHRTE